MQVIFFMDRDFAWIALWLKFEERQYPTLSMRDIHVTVVWLHGDM